MGERATSIKFLFLSITGTRISISIFTRVSLDVEQASSNNQLVDPEYVDHAVGVVYRGGPAAAAGESEGGEQ